MSPSAWFRLHARPEHRLHARCWCGHIQNRQVRHLLVPHHHQDRQKNHHQHNNNENCCCNNNKHFDDNHRCNRQHNQTQYYCHCHHGGNAIFNNNRTDYQSYERSNQQLPFNNDHSFD